MRTSSDTSQTNKPTQEETEQQQLGGSGSLPVGMERAGARLRASTKRQERSISGGGKEDEGQSSHQGAVNRCMSGGSERWLPVRRMETCWKTWEVCSVQSAGAVAII